MVLNYFKGIKKILAVFIVLGLSNWCIFMNYTPAIATEYDTNILIEEIDGLTDYFYPDTEMEISNIVPIFDDEGICEYAIDVSDGTNSYGYVVINDNYEITRFVIDDNSDGFVESNIGKYVDLNKKIYKTDLFTYQSSEEMLLGSYDDVLDICYTESYLSSFLSSYFNLDQKKDLKSYYTFGENFTDALGLDYACAVVAMLNVFAQNNLFTVRNVGNSQYNFTNIKAVYKNIWDIASPINGNIDATKMGSIVSQYVKKYNSNRKVTYSNSTNPAIGFFTNAINANQSSILGVIGSDSSTDGKKSGHAFNIIGYKSFQHYYYPVSKTFLRVGTGWGYDNEIGYIDYNNLNVYSTYGVKFSFK